MSKSILSLVKAGKILELFLDEERSLGITEFSKALEMPKATVQNLASTLEDMGYDVERLRPEGKDWNDDLRAKRGGHG